MNREQAEAAARVIMEAETQKLAERQRRTAVKQAKSAVRKRLMMYTGAGYFAGIALSGVFGWDFGPSGIGGLMLGLSAYWWFGRKFTARESSD